MHHMPGAVQALKAPWLTRIPQEGQRYHRGPEKPSSSEHRPNGPATHRLLPCFTLRDSPVSCAGYAELHEQRVHLSQALHVKEPAGSKLQVPLLPMNQAEDVQAGTPAEPWKTRNKWNPSSLLLATAWNSTHESSMCASLSTCTSEGPDSLQPPSHPFPPHLFLGNVHRGVAPVFVAACGVGPPPEQHPHSLPPVVLGRRHESGHTVTALVVHLSPLVLRGVWQFDIVWAGSQLSMGWASL